MLQRKDIKNISELGRYWSPKRTEFESLYSIINGKVFSKVFDKFAKQKSQGYDFRYLITIIISLPFMAAGKISNLREFNWITASKDAFYRLRSNDQINWRDFLYSLAKRFKKLTTNNVSTDDPAPKRITALVLDDTVIRKTGRRMELISRVHDHALGVATLGYKMLTLSFWDGKSLFPLDFALHSEKGKDGSKPYGLSKKELKNRHSKERDKLSHGALRIAEAGLTKIEMAVGLLKTAIKMGFKADYFLVDSWYSCYQIIAAVRKNAKENIHFLGMIKNGNRKFSFANQELNLAEIRNKAGKIKRNKKTGYLYIEAKAVLNNMPVKLFYSKRGRNGKWRALITTDTELSFDKMLKIYSIRWAIEVMFKECKQLLKLGRDQSIDFTAQISSITLTLALYIMLALHHRHSHYESLGALFRQTNAEVLDVIITERIWEFVSQLIELITECFPEADEMESIKRVLHSESFFKKVSNLIRISKFAA